MSFASRSVRRLSLVFCPLAAVACEGGGGFWGASSDTQVEPARYAIVEGCAETLCDAKMARSNAECDQCTHSCVRNPSCASSSCSALCKGSPCSTGDEACARTGLVAQLGAHDAAVYGACEASQKHARICLPDLKLGSCADYARIERSEVVAWYECFAKLPCKEIAGNHGECIAGDGFLLGAVVCGELAARSVALSCSEHERATLDEVGAWVRDDVREAGQRCAALERAEDVTACFRVWWASMGLDPWR